MSAFEGQTAVITGGGTGVGAAIPVALADAKVNVHLIGRRLERLEAVAASARRLGAHAACYSIELATESGQIKLRHDLSSIDSRRGQIVFVNSSSGTIAFHMMRPSTRSKRSPIACAARLTHTVFGS